MTSRPPYHAAAFRRPGPYVALIGAVTVLAWALTGCDPSRAEASSTPRIGVILPFSDELSHGSEEVKRALEMSLANRDDHVRFIFKDDGGQPNRTAELVHELATQERVLGIVGGLTSRCALAAAERAQALEIPFITPTATNPSVTREREWVFRMCFTDPEQGDRMARFAWSSLGRRSIAILRDVTNDYSTGLVDSFSSAFLDLGGLVHEWDFRRQYDSAESLEDWFASVQFDAVYLPLYSVDIIDFLNKTRDLWSSDATVLLGADAWQSTALAEYLEGAPEILSPIYITAHFAADRDAVKVAEFLKVARGPFREDWPPSSSAALGYDIGNLFVEAFDRPGLPDRAMLRDEIGKRLKDFRGASGDWTYNRAADRQEKQIHILTWERRGWILAP